jgi:hypothetical protein
VGANVRDKISYTNRRIYYMYKRYGLSKGYSVKSKSFIGSPLTGMGHGEAITVYKAKKTWIQSL